MAGSEATKQIKLNHECVCVWHALTNIKYHAHIHHNAYTHKLTHIHSYTLTRLHPYTTKYCNAHVTHT